MNSRQCPACTTHIATCDRCGQDHPQYRPPCPWNGSLNTREDVSICGKCYKELCSIVFRFYGRAYPADEYS